MKLELAAAILVCAATPVLAQNASIGPSVPSTEQMPVESMPSEEIDETKKPLCKCDCHADSRIVHKAPCCGPGTAFRRPEESEEPKGQKPGN